MTEDIIPTTIVGIKRLAKTISRRDAVSHMVACDRAARTAGFSNYRHAAKTLNAQIEARQTNLFASFVSLEDRSAWMKVLSHRPGLYVVSGRPSNGISDTIEASFNFIAPAAKGMIDLPGFVSFDGEHISESEVDDLAKSTAKGTVFKGEISSSADAMMAFGMARHFPVIAKFHLHSVEDASRALRFYSRLVPGVLRGLIFQECASEASARFKVTTAVRSFGPKVGLPEAYSDPNTWNEVSNVSAEDGFAEFAQQARSRNAVDLEGNAILFKH
ncbi:hypothetical protein G6L37_01645 [Agrobacterium rubi]|nr:hypothetical protein [Agrobacterium rubi]NTF24097.1 hypothetical protein [Agrobacterium rubi]